jgi:predicted PurR-regulated permease PerM
VAAFMVTQFIDNNFTGPMIFSKSVQAHPLEIFIVTLVAAKLGGIVGMIIGIPAYTVLRVIGRTFFSEFKLVQKLTGHL